MSSGMPLKGNQVPSSVLHHLKLCTSCCALYISKNCATLACLVYACMKRQVSDNEQT
eukprot:CAMPEP_0183437940 /NCGR_PEP_ID=MMETSP0370-20130417/75366_1 /TAXON_ID=268820 /ORGANISM="Peridinium aciculiferum, Strain PAER-2" /LENGTH=56 /DNA_ID=CAMNT_0025625969 /DNA_START=73 /DNA_END=243 /DNA_ORIENTATION=+